MSAQQHLIARARESEALASKTSFAPRRTQFFAMAARYRRLAEETAAKLAGRGDSKFYFADGNHGI